MAGTDQRLVQVREPPLGQSQGDLTLRRQYGVGMRAIRIIDCHDDPSDLPEADAVVPRHAEVRRLLLALAAQ